MGSPRPGSVERMEAIRLFLELVVAEDGSAASDERMLTSVLDRLALAARLTQLPEETTEREAPPRDYAALSARIAARFPAYGLYRAPSLDLEDEPLVGDAIDDLTDIALELLDVAWLHEHAGEAEALWHFRFGFETHWGSHLRALQWYLHERGGGRSEITG